MSMSDELVFAFDEAWSQAPPRPNWRTFLLPPQDASFAKHALVIFKIDLEHRLRRGDVAPLAHQYAAQFPQALGGPEQLELVEHELQQRWRRGDRVAPREYEYLFEGIAGKLNALTMRFDCPACRAEDVDIDDWEAESVVCPECSREFRIQDVFPSSPAKIERPLHLDLSQHEKLGEGSFGVVYRARDDEFGRPVAIKVLRREFLSNAAVCRRFEGECETLARLQHPGVPPVYGRGVLCDGRPFFSMHVVEGEPLKSLIGKHRHTLEGRAMLLDHLVSVAEIVAFAHRERLVHRDISPSNIVVGNGGEVYLTDWGSAAQWDQPEDNGPHDPAADDTSSGTFAPSAGCTPLYAAPELLSGKPGQRAPGVDVFSLGSILCEVLTGSPAYQEDTSAVIRGEAAEAELSNARQRLSACAKQDGGEGIDDALASIVLDMLHADAARRIAAADAARRLGNWQRNRVVELATAHVEAEKQRQLRNSEKKLRRYSLIAAASSFAGLLVAVFFALYGLWSAGEFRQAAHREAQLKEQATDAKAAADERAKDAASVARFLQGILLAPDPLGIEPRGLRQSFEIGKTIDARELLLRAGQRVDEVAGDNLLIRATLLDAIGHPLRGVGLQDAARPMLEESLRIRLRELKTGPAVAESHFHLAMLHHDARDFQPAQLQYQKTLDAISDKDAHRDFLHRVRFRYAWMLAEMRRTEEAMKLMRGVVSHWESKHGRNHAEVDVARVGLLLVSLRSMKWGRILQEAGKFADHESPVVRCLSEYVAAAIQRKSRNYELAKPAYARALELARSALPPRHPALALLLADAAGMHRETGDLARAEQLIEEAVSIGRETLPTHPLMLDALIRYAEEMEKQQRHDKAEKLYEEALKYAKKRQRIDGNEQRPREILNALIRLAERRGDKEAAQRFRAMLNASAL